MIDWLDRLIASANLWLEDHGGRQRTLILTNEITTKEYGVARFEEIRAAYLMAFQRRGKVA